MVSTHFNIFGAAPTPPPLDLEDYEDEEMTEDWDAKVKEQEITMDPVKEGIGGDARVMLQVMKLGFYMDYGMLSAAE